MRKHKERAVKYFGAFMLLMLACTIASRGIYANQMPQIQVGTPKGETLTRKITANGFVLTKEELPVVTEAGLLIEKVSVVEGQKVEAGELLFQIALSDLDQAIEKADLDLKAAESALSDLNASGSAAVNRASQDLKDIEGASSGEVSQAGAALQAAMAARDTFPSESDYKESAYQKDAEYQKLQKAAQKKNAKKQDKEAFQNYKSSLDAGLSESYAKERQALNDEVSEKEQAFNAANASKSDALKQEQRALEDARRGTGQGGAKYEQQNQIHFLREGKERLLALKEGEGKVLSGVSGYVSRILVHSGERTTDSSAIVLSDAAGEKLFQAVLPSEEKGYLVPGDTMSITFQGDAKDLYGVKIDAIGELEDGSCQVTARLEDTDAQIGETASMEINKEIGRFSCCIPVSALHTIDSTDFVYLVEEKSTILGTELSVQKRKVKVLNRDESFVALEDGALTDGEAFVAESDKELKDGIRVRLSEKQET